MNQIDFSIIIATRNRKDYLKTAIESILSQRDVCLEIIVIDDASNDGTDKVIDEMIELSCHSILYYKNDVPLFAHNSRKKGFLNSRGKYIIFMDDDDFYIQSDFFKRALDVFRKNDNVNTVMASTQKYKDEKFGCYIDFKKEGIVANIEYVNGFTKEFPKPMSTLSVAFRRSALEEAGLFEAKMVNDTCIYLYGLMQGDVYLINIPVAAYRVHESNMSKNSFSKQFVFDCLDEKIAVCRKICHINNIEDERQWIYRQMNITIRYFMKRAAEDKIFVLQIIWWVIINGKEIRWLFVKSLL